MDSRSQDELSSDPGVPLTLRRLHVPPRYEPRGRTTGEFLPRLLDCKHLREELGITRASAEAIMRQLPVIEPPGLRKVYVRRGDVAHFLEDNLRLK